MKTESGHTHSPKPDWQKLEELNSKLQVNWEDPKEAIWAKMENQLTEKEAAPARVIFLYRKEFRLAVAALVAVMLAMSAFMRYYADSYQIKAGEHLVVKLPDNSQVHMNAESSISYHPFWWAFARDLEFEGEAYFEVKKGSRFQVESTNGTTTVLGTSFNIYSRNEAYRVTCLTGKVKVSNPAGTEQVVLEPNEKAEWGGDAFFKINYESQQDIAWTTNQFVFTARSVHEVFDEIARQYNIQIEVADGIAYTYSGNFMKQNDIRSVLGYVCRPFGLNFTEVTAGVFRIEKN
ncbi:FecR family protein [Mangrovibacterium sp.]|uniref:FecR family protein n=1 Tax=Mangrovibacterium sp. TaxID=1961364 RepID=UPI003563120D